MSQSTDMQISVWKGTKDNQWYLSIADGEGYNTLTRVPIKPETVLSMLNAVDTERGSLWANTARKKMQSTAAELRRDIQRLETALSEKKAALKTME